MGRKLDLMGRKVMDVLEKPKIFLVGSADELAELSRRKS